MERFGFIVHPLTLDDVQRWEPAAAGKSEAILEKMLEWMPPFKVSHITGIRSAAGAEAEGWFVGCPLTAKQMMTLDVDFVMKKITEAVVMAETLGAGIVGLGAFTSVVGDGGITVAKGVNIPVTTGNSYTVATAVEGALRGAELMGIDPSAATVAVVGANGSIGKVCSCIMADKTAALSLVGRRTEALEALAVDLSGRKAVVSTTTDIKAGLAAADIVLTVTSATDVIIEADDLKRGAVVCDVSRPRNVSRQVAESRNDVLVIEGGVVAVPGEVEFNFNFGFPPRTAYACMSETMLLALDRCYESFTLGKDISLNQVQEISAMADRHGFTLAGFRSFERAVSPEQITTIRRNAGRN
ncbi:MAG: shikimate dehydrogenase [bacterium]|nr:shikimate dehydrogenase [bacterium]